MKENEIIFQAINIKKEFDVTVALKGADITLKRGEIRGLIGENGSGKSTIMSIAAGMQSATSGEMVYKGKTWNPTSMIDANLQGISMILQEANTIPGITVAQNIFAGREKEFTSHGIVRIKKMIRAAQALLDKYEIGYIHAADQIDRYNFEDRKLIELVRCSNENIEILVVDETTTALSHNGRNVLYKLIHQLAEAHKTVVLISHDIDEILEHCTSLTVLRDGEIMGELTKEDMQKSDIANKIRYLMIGREMTGDYYRSDYDSVCSEVSRLSFQHVTFGRIKDFNLEVHAGEIVGIGGLSGCGMHEIGRAGYGLEKLIEGKVLCDGKIVKSCKDAIKYGIGYISKNRDTEALILNGSIQDNIVLPSLPDLQKGIYISKKSEHMLSDKEIERFHIKCADGNQWVNTLSGGNKQKVSFAKWTAKGANIIIMDCPTRGVDVGVKQFMYQQIMEMKKAGNAILMISEELTELIGMSDRLLIMKDFEISGQFKRSSGLKPADMINYMV